MSEKMTLKQLRDDIAKATDIAWKREKWIAAIDAHINAAKGEAVEMSPEFTDHARAAIAWVLWHYQGASSPIGQPLRFALGMGAHEPLPDWRIREAKQWAAMAKATTAAFHSASPDVVRDAKSGLQPISTAPEKTVVVAAWVDEDGCTQYEFDFKEDGVWFEHNERYEHYLSCAPRDIPCTGPSEEAPYTHWLELPIIDAAMAAREGGE